MLKCIVCDHHQPQPLYDILFQCPQCHYVWFEQNLTHEVAQSLYADSYFFEGEYKDYLKEEMALRKNFERNLRWLSKFVSRGRLLEIGCAYGFFLDIARRQFEVEGLDINAAACQYAREQLKLNVQRADFLKTEFNKDSYDVVVMWATLEHVVNPHLYLQKISRLLCPGGIFACATIDIESFLSKIQKSKWRQIHPPTHLNYFSRETLAKLLERYGLRPRHAVYFGEYRSVDNALFKMSSNNKRWAKVYQWIKRWGLEQRIFYLNTYDTLYMVARKS